jgi:hypothetical protein
MNIVLIIPTGIGAEIGGHAGDGNPVAKLFGTVCDNLITHPNVVNASDINEMPDNTLYVEGSILDRFLEGEFCLEKVNYNKILLVVNPPIRKDIINSVGAARATVGADISVAVLEKPLTMVGGIDGSGMPIGEVYGWQELIDQVSNYKFDALAISTPIDVDRETKLNYFRRGGINPWGYVEAKASKLIANSINKPTAHAPVDTTDRDDDEMMYLQEDLIVDPRMAAEVVSICYLHCVLKGLHRAPRISDRGLSVNDVSFLITPINCVGPPHIACMKNGIPIIAVKENRTCLNDAMPADFIIVNNYLEAIGIVNCMKAGVYWPSVRRPIENTTIL